MLEVVPQGSSHYPHFVGFFFLLAVLKEIDIQIQELQRVPKKINPKRPTPRHIITNLSKVKYKKNLKSSKRKTVAYKGVPTRLSDDFSKETLQARRD